MDNEDIKILEDVLNDKDTKFWIGTQGIQAIKNLISRYKELEKENKEIKEEWSAEQKDEMKNTISKSKVKEKYVSKKELKKIIDENMYLEMMKKLKELLES